MGEDLSVVLHLPANVLNQLMLVHVRIIQNLLLVDFLSLEKRGFPPRPPNVWVQKRNSIGKQFRRIRHFPVQSSHLFEGFDLVVQLVELTLSHISLTVCPAGPLPLTVLVRECCGSEDLVTDDVVLLALEVLDNLKELGHLLVGLQVSRRVLLTGFLEVLNLPENDCKLAPLFFE